MPVRLNAEEYHVWLNFVTLYVQTLPVDSLPLDLHICERDVCNLWTINQCMQHSIDISISVIMVLLFCGFLKYSK